MIRRSLGVIVDVTGSSVYGFYIFWVLSQILEFAQFGRYVFGTAVIAFASPFLIMNLHTYVFVQDGVDFRKKMYFAKVYIPVLTLLVLCFTLFFALIAGYQIDVILLLIASIFRIIEIFPRTYIRNIDEKKSLLINSCLLIFTFFVSAFVFYIAPNDFSVVYFCLSIFSLMVQWINLPKQQYTSSINRSDVYNFLHFSLPLLVSGFIVLAYTKVDQIMIKFFLGYESLASYGVAVRIIDGAVMVWTTIQSYWVKRLFDNDADYIIFFKFAWVFGTSACVAVLFFGEFFVNFFFSFEYHESLRVLFVLLPLAFFIPLNSVSSFWLQRQGLVRLSPYRSLLGFFMNICFNFVFIPIYGLYGAAIGTVLAQFAVCFVFPAVSAQSRGLYALLFLGVFR